MLNTHPLTRVFGLAALNAALVLAGDQITLNGMESGYFALNSPPQVATVLSNDFAEGIGSRFGKYSLVGREQINTATGAVTEGASITVDERGDTIHGTYSGQANFQAASATWVAEGHIEGGTGRFAGSMGTVRFPGSADLSTCKSVAALSAHSRRPLPHRCSCHDIFADERINHKTLVFHQ